MKLTQNEVEAAEVLNNSKYKFWNAWDFYGDKQRNKR